MHNFRTDDALLRRDGVCGKAEVTLTKTSCKVGGETDNELTDVDMA